MIPFLKYTKIYILISTFVISVGVFTLFTRGLPLNIDFTGGSVVEYLATKPISDGAIRQALKKEKVSFEKLDVQGARISLKTQSLSSKQEAELRGKLQATTGQLSVQKFDTVGPSLGGETMKKTLIASLVAMAGILLYISYTFKKFSYGAAAVLAMVHDFCVLVGMYAVLGQFGAQVDALFVTALLTTMSFSVHDTIVVFDKIREYRRTSGLSMDILANKALTETMVRSLNNSFTIVLMLVPLTFMGGEAIRFFAAALLIGTITGTYSSPFVATPLLVWLNKRK